MALVRTSVLNEGLSGTSGSVVFVQTQNGIVVRQRVVPKNPRTPAQTAVRSHLAQAVAAYRTLTPAQAAQWQAYAQTQFRIDTHSDKARRPTAYAASVGLATRFVRVTPDDSLPATPPAFPFAGDRLTLTATADAGNVTFSASGPTTPDTRIELLWQPLKFAHQAVQTTRYRTQGYAVFTPDALAITLPAPPGWAAPAYRFVNVLTGQDTDIAHLPPLQVT